MDSLSRNQFKRLVNAQDKELMELYKERAALRKLCRDMYDCYTSGQYKECYECEYFDKRESHCGFTDRMDALGLLEGGDNE